MTDAAATASPAEEVVHLVAELCAAVEARSKAVPALALVLSAFFLRLGRLGRGLAGLVARISAGKPRPARKRRAPAAAASPRVRKPSEWPTKFRALAELLGDDAAQFADRLRAWLADPDSVAYVVANPEIGRYLRPLCRTLGVRRIPELRRKREPRAALFPEAPAPETSATEAPPLETPSAEPSATCEPAHLSEPATAGPVPAPEPPPVFTPAPLPKVDHYFPLDPMTFTPTHLTRKPHWAW